MMYTFGSGTLIAKRTDLANKPPALLGVLQDVSVDMDQSLKSLMGQYKVAIDIAPAELKIMGKAKFARIQASTFDNLILGSGLAGDGVGGFSTGAGTNVSIAENQTSSGTTFTVTNGGANFVEDLGLFYASSGIQLTPVASSPGVGQYSVTSTGGYTVADSSGTKYQVFYDYKVSNLNQITLTNQFMGTGPVFEVILSTVYAVAGVNKTFNLKLNACRSSKLSMPLKNQDYMIPELDFQAFADQNNGIASWWLSE